MQKERLEKHRQGHIFRIHNAPSNRTENHLKSEKYMSDMFASVSTAIEIGKRLTELAKKIENVEFNHLLADLNLELAETKHKLSGLVMENIDLKEENHALKKKRESEADFVEFNGVAFKRKPSGGFEDSVYCPFCKVGMATTSSGDMPYVCGKCSSLSGFKSKKLKQVMEEMIKEYGQV